MSNISIAGLRKADVLASLYNAARAQGRMGLLLYEPKPMTRDEAERLCRATPQSFDYLKGRVLKLVFMNDTDFNSRLYDRDNGEGAAEKVVSELRRTGDVNAPAMQEMHWRGMNSAFAEFQAEHPGA